MTLTGPREVSVAEMSSSSVGLVCCVHPLRRHRRLVVQSLTIALFLVVVTVLLSSHRRRSSTPLDPVSAAADTLRRLVRSVQEAGPDSGRVIVGDDGSNGYLLATVNGSRPTDVEFRSYGDAVDLRLIVLAYDRPESLAECLASLEAAEYGDDDRVALHVWIDGSTRNDDDDHDKTIDVARSFNFSHGTYHVHVRPQHVGVQVGMDIAMEGSWECYDSQSMVILPAQFG